MSNLNPTEQELSIINAMGKAAGVVKTARKTDLVEHFKAGYYTLDTVSAYLETQRGTRPHWFGESPDAINKISDNKGGSNPWSAANWNVTEQGKVIKAIGLERAAQIAAAAGSKIGATKPAKAA